MVSGLPQIKDSSRVCENCMVGKQPRDPFPKRSTLRASQSLQLIHADICGPIKPASNSKKRYLLTFIDDFTRKTWVYFLVEKSEAFRFFKVFKSLVENETDASIKSLRTDRGGEFTSHEFVEFCVENGIQRQLTAAYTPQQNGVAERKNRTIMNMVRSLLTKKKMPKTFWPEAANWTVHVLNRSPTLAVKNKTPEEAWSGTIPSVSYFRVFGCISYVHIPDNKRTKLDDKSMKCVLLGVSKGSKAYRLFEPVSQKIIISRDVRFDENSSWVWDEHHHEAVIADLEWDDDEDTTSEANEVDSEGGDEDGFDGNDNDTSNNSGSDKVSEANSSSSEERRPRNPLVWMRDYVTGEGLSEEEEATVHLAFLASSDPVHYNEAVKNAKWRKAMDVEVAAIEKNNTWELTDLPQGGKIIGVKWVYKTKLNENGEVDKYKARLVANGYAQEYGVDYAEVFAHVARLDTIRIVIALAAQREWTIHQMDVKNAFLHGEINEEIFVEQPPGYVQRGKEHKVYKLRKALYGLKQAPRAWYSRIEAYFLKEWFVKCPHEHTLFIKVGDGGNILVVCLYVDDLIYTGNDESMFSKFKQSMMNEFEMTDLGKMRYFLGIEVLQKPDGIFICQKKYAQEVLERFNMGNCNPVHNPIVPGTKLTKDLTGERVDNTYYKQIVGSLMYLAATRPDTMFVVSLISRFMEGPTEMHLAAAKRVLRYVKGTIGLGVLYRKGEHAELRGYTDSDYAGDLDDRKSTSGYLFMLGSGVVCWSSKKQPVVTLSTTETEFIATASSACQATWLRRIMKDLG
ncbi:hypothetical protein ACFX2B_017883 [Malus domestica]